MNNNSKLSTEDLMKTINNFSSFLASLKNFNDLKDKSYNNENLLSVLPNFGDLFKDLDKLNLNDIYNKSDKNDVKNFDNSVNVNNDKPNMNENTDTDKGSIMYTYRDDSLEDDYEIYSAIMADNLDKYTFIATCSNSDKYNLDFIFGKKHFKYTWNPETMHFDGEFEYDDNTIDTCKFWYDEVERRFVAYNDGNTIISSLDVNLNPDKLNITCTDDYGCNCTNECECSPKTCDCQDNKSCTRECEKNNNPITPHTIAASLFEKLNCDREQQINEIIPSIIAGIERVINYNMFIPVRSTINSPIDTIVFTLEDVSACSPTSLKQNFWDVIEYLRLANLIKDAFGFAQVFIFDDNGDQNQLVHTVRCTLK